MRRTEMPSEPHPSSSKNDSDALPLYTCQPPHWLPPLHAGADLGYISFHPPHPGQEEEILSENNVKNGFSINHPVPAETLSAYTVYSENAAEPDDTLAKLQDLMTAVLRRRKERLPPVPASTFRLPSRVTLSDTKRQAWFADLANPDVPLYKLSKSVPHGAKGHDLLDLLHRTNVPIPRAVWFLRVFGANETASVRNRPNYDPTQYSVDWTNIVTSYLKKQLNEITLPNAPRPGLNIKQTFRGVLTEADSRDRWVSRYSYSQQLIKPFFEEGLLDHRTFLSWIVQTFLFCNIPQTSFVAALAEGYFQHLLNRRALLQPFLRCCLTKLNELQTPLAEKFLKPTITMLKSFVQRIVFSRSESLIHPRLWIQHEILIRNIFAVDASATLCSDIRTAASQQKSSELLQAAKKRNESMMLQNLPLVGLARLGTSVAYVEMLNSIDSDTRLSSVPYWATDQARPMSTEQKVEMLLTWSVSPLQYGDHRPLAAVTLLRHWRESQRNVDSRNGSAPSPEEFLQDQCFEWLDTHSVAGDSGNIHLVAMLFGKLVKHDLFSYPQYIQRLVARRDWEETEQTLDTRHQLLLTWIPLHFSLPEHVQLRKSFLYGPRVRQTPDEAMEKTIRHEFRIALPDLFGGDSQQERCIEACSTILSAPRYVQVRIFRDWFVPFVVKTVQAYDHAVLSVCSFCLSAELMSRCHCFHSLIDLVLAVLKHADTAEYLTALLTIIDSHRLIWACMEETSRVVHSLYETYQTWKDRGIRSRTLLALLLDLDAHTYLNSDRQQQLAAELPNDSQTMPVEFKSIVQVPDDLPDVPSMAVNHLPSGNSLITLAHNLWFKYRGAQDLSYKVWDNIVRNLRGSSAVEQGSPSHSDYARCCGLLLIYLDQRLSEGLDEHVLLWFQRFQKSLLSNFSAEAWGILVSLIVFLCAHSALQSITVMLGLVYPTWEAASEISKTSDASSLFIALRSVNDLFRALMLRSHERVEGRTLQEAQTLQAHSLCVLRKPNFSRLAGCIPTLVVIENHDQVEDASREQMQMVRQALCRLPAFRLGAYADLGAVRSAFEGRWSSTSSQLRERMLAALDMVLSDDFSDTGRTSWKNISSLLSPWKLAATSIKLRFMFSQMGESLADPVLRSSAIASLTELSTMIFHDTVSSEQAFFFADMATGTDVAVVSKFVNTGLSRITQLLNTVSSTEGYDPFVQRAGDFLRLLARVCEPLRKPGTVLPGLEASVQEQFFDAFCKRVDHIWQHRENFGDRSVATPVFRMLTFLLRLIQFNIVFPGAWTPNTKLQSTNLIMNLFRLAVACTAGDFVPLPHILGMLLDTACLIIDESPMESKAPNLDLFRLYPPPDTFTLNPRLPEHLTQRLHFVLNYFPPHPSVDGLLVKQTDQQGNVRYYPLKHRPWEWTEYIGEAEDPEKDREEKRRLGSRYLIKNSGSLSLELFNAQPTGDGLIRNHFPSGSAAREIAQMRSFEDSLSSEGVFERSIRESHFLSLEPYNRSRAQTPDNDASSSHSRKDKASPRSPVSPGFPRSPVAPSNLHFNHGFIPTPSNLKESSTLSDVESQMSVNSVVTAGAKRKAPVEDLDDVTMWAPDPLKGKKAAKTTQSKVAKKKR